MFMKSYHAFEQVVSETINDPNKYDQAYDATANADFRHQPLQTQVIVQGTTIAVTAANALCAFAAEKMNIVGSVNCGASTRDNPNFITSNGVVWWGLDGAIASETAKKVVNVDVNGAEDDGQYKMHIFYDGKVSVPTSCSDCTCVSGKCPEEEFIQTQTKVR
jgi:hypothetical protein